MISDLMAAADAMAVRLPARSTDIYRILERIYLLLDEDWRAESLLTRLPSPKGSNHDTSEGENTSSPRVMGRS